MPGLCLNVNAPAKPGHSIFPQQTLGSGPSRSLILTALYCSHECQGCKWISPHLGEENKTKQNHAAQFLLPGDFLWNRWQRTRLFLKPLCKVPRAGGTGTAAFVALHTCIMLATLNSFDIWIEQEQDEISHVPFHFHILRLFLWAPPETGLPYNEEREIVVAESGAEKISSHFSSS